MLVAIALMHFTAVGRAAPVSPQPPNSQEVAELLESGAFELATEKAGLGLELAIQANPPSTRQIQADWLELFVEANYSNGNRRTSEILARSQQLVQLRREIGDASELARVLYLQGLVQYAQRKYLEAADSYSESLTLRQALLGWQHPEIGEVLSALAYLRFEGRTSWLEWSNAPDSQEICDRTLSENQRTGLNLAFAAWVAASESQELAPKAAAATVNRLAVMTSRAGCRDSALQLLQTALDLKTQAYPANHPEIGRGHHNLGIAFENLGDLDNGLLQMEQGLSVREATLRTGHPQIASSRNALGSLLFAIGAIDRSEDLLQAALVDLRAGYGSSSFRYATALHNLGNFLFEVGATQEAKVHVEEAIRIRRLNANEKLSESLALQALMAIESGSPSDARVAFKKARDAMPLGSGENHPLASGLLVAMASLELGNGNVNDAASLFRKAIVTPGITPIDKVKAQIGLSRTLASVPSGAGEGVQILAEVQTELSNLPGVENARTHPLMPRLLLARTSLLTRSGDIEGALAAAEEAHDACLRLMSEVAAFLPQRVGLEASRLLSQSREQLLGLAVRLVPEKPEVAMQAWMRIAESRGIVFETVKKRFEEPASANEFAGLRQAHQEAKRDLAEAWIRAEGRFLSPEMAGAAIERARSKADLTERNLARSVPVGSSEAEKVQLSRSLGSLPKEAAVVAYSTYRPVAPSGQISEEVHYLVLIRSSPDDPVTLVPLGPKSTIDKAIQRFRNHLATPPTVAKEAYSYRESGARVRELIWDPIVSLLPEKVSDLALIPSGELSFVSWSALPIGDDRFLIESGPTIHLLEGERDLQGSRSKGPSKSGRLLALGDPDFDALLPRRPLKRPPIGHEPVEPTSLSRGQCLDDELFPQLPGARKEVQTIARLWDAGLEGHKSVVLVGPDATETKLRKSVPNVQVLHIATHGLAPSGSCQDRKPGARGSQQTLLPASLVLAGANSRAKDAGVDDGFLTTEEIVSLDLSGVEWVVLSGCETGLGSVVSGEGVIGLRRAFRQAGARTVVSSLWPVDDQNALEWTTEFYNYQGQDRTAAAAVRNASLTTLRNRKRSDQSTHPFFWAAFAASGIWEPNNER